MTPVELPYVPILLNETFITALWDTGAEKSFISEEGYFPINRLTHVVYHEIDTGDKGPVVSRPYKYDRVKQGIIDYHIDKMLRDGTICPINSPYASPVVLTRKNNDLPPDSPEAYRFAIDYRKLNGITKYLDIHYRLLMTYSPISLTPTLCPL
ncbi:retrovirus-related Pol polyprotein from transposon 17.6 [Trichonephila clavipes]|nr:retrovirus-related Pol polyprotein from transposon 17.6 [Trichonephila clavipes]